MSGMNTLNLYPQVYAEYIPMMAELEKQTYPFYSMEYAKEVMRDTLEKTFTEEEKAETLRDSGDRRQRATEAKRET